MEKEPVLNFFLKFYKTSTYSMPNWYEAKVVINEEIKNSLFFRLHNENIYLTSINNAFDYNVIDTILKSVDEIISQKEVVDYSKFNISQIEIFDSILFVNSQFHSWFKTVDENIYKCVIFFIPINHCEFGGTDGFEFSSLARHITIPSNWKREISPLAMIKLNLPHKGIKSKTEFRYEKEDMVYKWLSYFQEKNDWMQIKNYKDDMLYIRFNVIETMYEISNNNDLLIKNSFEELKKYLKLFLTN
jgi:hypothetical protein